MPVCVAMGDSRGHAMMPHPMDDPLSAAAFGECILHPSVTHIVDAS